VIAFLAIVFLEDGYVPIELECTGLCLVSVFYQFVVKVSIVPIFEILEHTSEIFEGLLKRLDDGHIDRSEFF
jgi:hypothetical protein